MQAGYLIGSGAVWLLQLIQGYRPLIAEVRAAARPCDCGVIHWAHLLAAMKDEDSYRRHKRAGYGPICDTERLSGDGFGCFW